MIRLLGWKHSLCILAFTTNVAHLNSHFKKAPLLKTNTGADNPTSFCCQHLTAVGPGLCCDLINASYWPLSSFSVTTPLLAFRSNFQLLILHKRRHKKKSCKRQWKYLCSLRSTESNRVCCYTGMDGSLTRLSNSPLLPAWSCQCFFIY